MQRLSTLARLLVVGALAVFVLLVGASIALAQEGTTVQGSNTSSDVTGSSGDVAVTNDATVTGGPSSAAADGSTSSTAMKGDTSANLSQNSSGASGPASAGSQTLNPKSGSTTQATNNSSGVTATSGPVTVVTTATVNAGPSSTSSGAGSVASTTQDGDVDVDAVQDNHGFSGPAIGGSQFVFGIGDGDGDALTQGTNVATDGTAVSGAVVVISDLFGAAGASSTAADGGIATTAQDGDDDATLTQSNVGASGAAMVASQLFGNSGGDIQNTNTSTGDFASTGDVATVAVLSGVAGPFSTASGPGSVSTTVHDGDADVVADQVTGGFSGNSVVGSQLTGFSSVEEAFLSIRNQQSGDADPFFSSFFGDDLFGPGLGEGLDDRFDHPLFGNGSAPFAGYFGLAPIGEGTSVMNTNVSEANVGSSGPVFVAAIGDAAAGPGSISATSATGPGATAGTATASASQAGDADATLVQDTLGVSGDLFVGSQEALSTIDDGAGDVLIQDTNVSDTNLGLSGPAVVTNFGSVDSGPLALASSTAVSDATGTATAGNAVATVAQDGDTDAELDQVATGISGDVDLASQRASASGDGDVTIQDTNVADLNVAVSGIALSSNAGDAIAGPTAIADSSASASGTSIVTAGDAAATTVQDGDDRSRGSQESIARSGDVSVASQSTQATAASEVTAQNTNAATSVTGISGFASAANAGGWEAGPFSQAASSAAGTDDATVEVGDAVAVTDQVGDDRADWGQLADSASGDVLAGSQDTLVSSDDADVLVENTNVVDTALGISGGTVVLNTMDGATGPAALAVAEGAGGIGDAITIGAATAVTTQDGDDRSTAVQEGTASSGDVVVSSEITDVHAQGVDVTVQAFNGSTDAQAFSGTVFDSGNDLVATVGTLSQSAPTGADDATSVAAQSGDNRLNAGQASDAATGLAAAASIVVGFTGSGDDALFQLDNVTATASATTGNILSAVNSAAATLGTTTSSGGGFAVNTQDGDNSVTFTQLLPASTGDVLTGVILAGNDAEHALDPSGLELESLTSGGVVPLRAADEGTIAGSVSGDYASLTTGDAISL